MKVTLNKKLYKETFSALKASDDTLTEVMKMTTEKKRIPLKTPLIAAVFAVMLTFTAFAYGGAIAEFMFGDSNAKQVESESIDGVSHMIEFHNYIETPDIDVSGAKRLSSFDEIRGIVPFDVKEPSFMPHDGSWKITAITAHYLFALYSGGTEESIYIYQYYLGPDARVDLTAAHSIEKVMVGDIEAAVIYENDNTCLYFLKYGIMFSIQGYYYDLDTFIAIAQSL